MATADDVISAVQAALQATRIQVSISSDLPTRELYPNLKLRLKSEAKQSIGRNSLRFKTLVIIRVIGGGIGVDQRQ